MRVITLGNGKQVSLAAYVAEVKRVKDAPACTRYSHTLCNWFPGTREDILREFLEGVEDRINRHLVIRNRPTDARMYKLISRKVRGECKWCGSAMSEYRPGHSRFCSDGCKRDYYS